jgi:two-component system, response regulator
VGTEGLAVTVLVAEDDDDDFHLTREAFGEALVAQELIRVRDGEELLDYLLRRGSYERRAEPLGRLLILLDLNMPRMDGREALRELKAHPELRRIPVIALTTSKAEEDIVGTYDLGVNSFIRKPVRHDQFVDAVRTLKRYWLDLAEIPPSPL